FCVDKLSSIAVGFSQRFQIAHLLSALATFPITIPPIISLSTFPSHFPKPRQGCGFRYALTLQFADRVLRAPDTKKLLKVPIQGGSNFQVSGFYRLVLK